MSQTALKVTCSLSEGVITSPEKDDRWRTGGRRDFAIPQGLSRMVRTQNEIVFWRFLFCLRFISSTVPKSKGHGFKKFPAKPVFLALTITCSPRVKL